MATNSLPMTSLIEQMANELLLKTQPEQDSSYRNAAYLPQDTDWIKQSFMMGSINGKAALSDDDILASTFSSATLKYTDSSIGGNIAINSPPMFTRYADIPDPGIHAQYSNWFKTTSGDIPNYVNVALPTNPTTNYGMGHYYSEAIDDNNQIIHLRFGVPTYNSLTQFFTGFYSSGMASVARAGRFNGDFLNGLLRGTGNLIGLALMPLFIVPIAILAVGSAFRYFIGSPSTKFYYLKPSMPTYWAAVTTLVNQFSTMTGLSNNINTKQAQDVNAKGNGIMNGGDKIQSLVAKFLPDGLMNDNGLIDVRAIASRSKRLEIAYNKALADILDKINTKQGTYDDHILHALEQVRSGAIKREGIKNIETYLWEWVTSWFGGGATTEGGGDSVEKDFRADATPSDPSGQNKTFTSTIKEGAKKVADFFVAETADGADWVSFRVDYTGQTSESFDNSTSPSSLASKINDMSSSNREIRMNMAEGNILPGMGSIIEGISQVVGGAAEVLHIDGIASLAGSAFVDIPEHWDNAHAQLPRSDYTIRLISPYGNPVSMMFDIYIPLACLMAGALPLATGAQSYTSPFLCQLHDKGRNFIRLGIIDRLSISRGVSNLGFNKDGKALAIDVSFSVKNLSSVVALPITTGFSVLNPLQGLFDDDNAFTDYLMAMCGVPLTDTIYKMSAMRYRLDNKINDFNSYFSASHLASMMTSFPGVGLMNAVFKGTNK